MADQLRGGSSVGGYEIVTTKEVPMIFRVDAGNLQYSEDGGITWNMAQSSNDTTATAANLLTGVTAYINGVKTTGTMPNRGAVSQALAINGTYTIPAGYHNGSGKVTQSITTKAAATITPKTTNQTIAAGTYLSGTQTIAGDADLVAANILAGKNIFNVAGTAKRQASGSTTSTTVAATLGWQPSKVLIKYGAGGFMLLSSTADLYYRSYDSYGAYTQYSYYSIYMSYDGTLTKHLTTTSMTTTGFSIVVVGYYTATDTFSWIAYE